MFLTLCLQYDQTSLLQASSCGDYDTVQLLLHKGADITATDGRRVSILSSLLQVLRRVYLSYLLHVYGIQFQRSALHYACYGGHYKTAELLLDSGADITSRDRVSVAKLAVVHAK